MYYHLALTDECNLQCNYCKGQCPDDTAHYNSNGRPDDFSVDPGMLSRFLEEDHDAMVIFYGGEPLLRDDLVERLVRELPGTRFLLHTNGTLLDRLSRSALGNIEKVQVSIDGTREVTDRNRGAGIYDRIVENVKQLRHDGYDGEIVARMTVERGDRIMESVLHLDSMPWFTSVHWQLNAMFCDDYDLNFTGWAETGYNPAIRSLASEWLRIMEKEGRVPRWYPFLGPVSMILSGKSDSRLRCGCGFLNYSIMTDGSIVPCPCVYGLDGFTIGHIESSHPQMLPETGIGDPCTGCTILGFCGGRCLYAHVASPWPDEGRATVCNTVKNLKESLEAVVPRIKELISEGKIKENDFGFEGYWGCEVIP